MLDSGTGMPKGRDSSGRIENSNRRRKGTFVVFPRVLGNLADILERPFWPYGTPPRST